MERRGLETFPYQLLGLVLGIVAGVQAPIIMMSQNRQAEKERLRADLDFQINLKNELALAEVLRRLDLLESERLPHLFAEQNALFADAKQTSIELGDGKFPPALNTIFSLCPLLVPVTLGNALNRHSHRDTEGQERAKRPTCNPYRF